MKELYFSSENIEQKSIELMNFTFRNLKKKVFKVNTKSMALIVLDMQEFFVNESSHAFIPSAKAIFSNIQYLIEIFKKNNRPVIFTKHLNNPANARLMQDWWRDLIDKDHEKSQITSLLDTKDCTIIEKSQYDAFYNTELQGFLEKDNIKQIVITGVMTHLCCETTARSAFIRGFEPFFIIDATATYNEDFHKASLLNLAHGFATITSTKDLCEVLNG